MPGIDGNDIHIVQHILFDQEVHKEAFAKAAGPKYKFVAVIDSFCLHEQIRQVYPYRNALPVS